METVLQRCAGLDIHQRTVVATVRVPAAAGTRASQTATFGTMTVDLLALRDWLQAQGVTHVAMESTGVYWRPVYYVLEADFTLLLVNMQLLSHVPGRKTDVRDSEWLAQLLECGLLRGSLVPPQPIRDLRDLTRYRRKQIEDRTQEVNRLYRVLEDAGLKLASVMTDVMGVSGRAIWRRCCEARPIRRPWRTWRGAACGRSCRRCDSRCAASTGRITPFSSRRFSRRWTFSKRRSRRSRPRSIGS